MERKTMGSFIAALRKANGMTQKELAERLNVSDKAVSRWERDENAPDLSLIPVIAEIFGVTSDELLRGQRADPAAGNTARAAEKTEKQIRRLAASVSSDFRIHGIIAAGIALAGLVAAMIGNFGFNRAYVGFFTACLFFIAAAVSETIFLVRAFASLNDSFDHEAIDRCKRSLVFTAELSFSLILVLLAAALPLVVLTPHAYAGLTAGSWFQAGLFSAVCGALLCFAVCLLLNLALAKRGVCGFSKDRQAAAKRRVRYVFITLFLIGLSFILHQRFTYSASLYAQGTVFQDPEEFIDYMETPKSDPNGESVDTMTGPFFDENGREITKKEFLTQTVCDPSGQTLFTYLRLNRDVSSIEFKWSGGNLKQITVCTYEEMDAAQTPLSMVNAGFYVLYVVELAVSLLLYFRKKKT